MRRAVGYNIENANLPSYRNTANRAKSRHPRIGFVENTAMIGTCRHWRRSASMCKRGPGKFGFDANVDRISNTDTGSGPLGLGLLRHVEPGDRQRVWQACLARSTPADACHRDRFACPGGLGYFLCTTLRTQRSASGRRHRGCAAPERSTCGRAYELR